MNNNIKFYIVIFLVLVLGIFIFLLNNKKITIKKNSVTIKPSLFEEKEKVQNINKKEIIKSIFVPYWTLNSNNNFDNYERLIYFGLSTKENNINKDEQGYLNLEKSISIIPQNKQKYLTLRMTNTEENIKVLNNNVTKIRIIDQLIEISKKYNFEGVVLDLEMGVLFEDDLVSKINNFSNTIYENLKKENIKYTITIYGDVFYRKRPYDIKNLAENSDEIMIMAYDFHKSIGEPGPNFPLNRGNAYSYDFKTMINDYLKFVQPEKLSVIFGLYGYDWIVDEKERPIKQATSLSFNEIKNKYLDSCIKPKCDYVIDNVSFENKITVIDTDSKKHIVWFEDERSVNEKINYLKSVGISNISYWANEYF